MKPKQRFIQSVVATARQTHIALPWHRGAPRATLIANRDAPHSHSHSDSDSLTQSRTHSQNRRA